MLQIRPHKVNDDIVVKQVDNPQMSEILKLPLTFDGSEGSQQIALFNRDEIQVGALIGAGSFSEVYEIKNIHAGSITRKMSSSRQRKRESIVEEHEKNAKDLYTGKALRSRYVIKHLHLKLLSDPKLFRRALRDLATEVNIMSSLEHPHIAQLHATAAGGSQSIVKTGKHDSYFIVLDRLVQTLDDRIAQWNQEKIETGPSYYLNNATNHSRMSLKVNYALQIASALEYLHERRIVYRDLKPQNIGFKEVHPGYPEQDVLALFDFGLSRHLPSPEKANSEGLFKMSLVGTRRYMSPETVLTKLYDERADVYSFALVFYEVVCQSRPFDGIQREEHRQFVCKEGKRPKIYSYFGLPPELERLMRFGWAQDVSKRVSMKHICETLQSHLVGTIHEGCVRTNDAPIAMISEDDTASVTSESTEKTVQSVSTTTSSGHSKKVANDGVNVDSVPVPQAIAVSSAPTTTIPTEAEEGFDPPRHVSLCERLMVAVCKSITRQLRKCFDRR